MTGRANRAKAIPRCAQDLHKSFVGILTDNPHPLPHLLNDLQRPGELIFRVRRGHDGAQAGFAFGDCRKGDAGSKYPFIEQLAAELHG